MIRTNRSSRLPLVAIFAFTIAGLVSAALVTASNSTVSANSTGPSPTIKSSCNALKFPNSGANSPASFTWTSAGNLHTARAFYTTTLLPNGMVLAAGGYGAAPHLRSAELYDPVADTWTPTGNMSTVRMSHSATLLNNGKVLVAGGHDDRTDFATAELFDPAFGSWTTVGDLPSPHSEHTATLLPNGKVLVVGGYSHDNVIVNAAALFDPASNTWSMAAPPVAIRARHTATLLQNGKVLVAAGSNVSGATASAELYNPATNTWSGAGNLTVPRTDATATLLPNGKVLVVGGDDGSREARSADLYDPVANTWTSTDPLSISHARLTATLLQNGKVLVVGSAQAGSSMAELYDSATGKWSDTASLKVAREGHSATLLADGRVLAAGGFDQETVISSSELYNPLNPGSTGGPRIVFGSVRGGNNHDIYSTELDGSHQIRLTNNPAYDDQPKWSPDRSKIAFISDRDGNFEVYTMNADGTGQTGITNDFAADGFPSWSPDGARIAFVRGDLRNPSTFEIYSMKADGSNQTRLTNDNVIDGVPSWSHDGTKIVFMSGGSSVFDPNSFEIYSMNADGSNRTRLTNNNVADGQPSYSPDGTKILFASGDALNPGGIEIYVMNADGSNRTRLTNNSVTDGFPAWSFDGLNIVFASGNISDETSVELYLMNATGTQAERITSNAQLDWFPDWEPVQSAPSQIQLNAANYVVPESGQSVTVTVTRTGNVTGLASVRYATSDTAGANDCSLVGSAASARCDYETALGTLNFAAGEISRTITVFVVDDPYHENNESFSVSLSNVSGSGAGLGVPASATVTINDDDAVTGSNQIDNSGPFVRQHYLDFLNREPDIPGRNFWTSQIDSCGTDQTCTEIRRINVSAAFFLSIEFQETGYLVYRMYKAAYNPPGMPVPVRYEEFIGDTQQIGKDVIVGAGDWQARLEANKQSFAVEFVMRLRFLQDHPLSQTPVQFVDALFANAGVTPSPAERTSLINAFGGAPTSADTFARAGVLRQVSEHAQLKQQEFNKAFVLMQYFGYLRRNPFDAPEPTLDFQGYNFWLNKLNQFNGNFVSAEMVKSFLVSAEYRHRFGP